VKVLVTGAGGFLGVHVVERLLAHGYCDLRCFLRDASKEEALRSRVQQNSAAEIEFVYGNLRSRNDCACAVQDVSLVVHLAAGLKGSPAELFADSVISSRNLLEALEARSAPPIQDTRVVLVSSFGVYGVVPLGRRACINEETPLEAHPERRDPYSFTKLRQEQLIREHSQRAGFELVVLRPGVIYGPGGGAMSNRVGLQIGPIFAHLGGSNRLPLSFVQNCAEAIVVAGTHPHAAGQVYNVHDDDLPTASSYLHQYKKHVRRIHSVRIPYWIALQMASMLESYHCWSKGQLPAILTRYKVAAAWAGNVFDNSKLRGLGWRPLVSTQEGLAMTFRSLRGSDSGK
jgi:nucleoside-diphosphate-sugar epimerase